MKFKMQTSWIPPSHNPSYKPALPHKMPQHSCIDVSQSWGTTSALLWTYVGLLPVLMRRPSFGNDAVMSGRKGIHNMNDPKGGKGMVAAVKKHGGVNHSCNNDDSTSRMRLADPHSRLGQGSHSRVFLRSWRSFHRTWAKYSPQWSLLGHARWTSLLCVPSALQHCLCCQRTQFDGTYL